MIRIDISEEQLDILLETEKNKYFIKELNLVDNENVEVKEISYQFKRLSDLERTNSWVMEQVNDKKNMTVKDVPLTYEQIKTLVVAQREMIGMNKLAFEGQENKLRERMEKELKRLEQAKEKLEKTMNIVVEKSITLYFSREKGVEN